MNTRPTGHEPSGSAGSHAADPFAGLNAGIGAGLEFFQDWLKAAGSAMPHLQGATGMTGAPGMPAWTMPTLDPAELEKRIQDLKTVQFWLEQNARMISMTIQGLEVQRMTLATLQGMNVSMDALRESLKVRPDASAGAAGTASSQNAAASSSGSTSSPSPWGSRHEAPPPEPAASPEDADDTAGGQTAGGPAQEGSASELINPMRWWDTLTQQFTHLASQAAQTVNDSVGESMDRLKQAQAKAAAAAAQAAPSKAKGEGAGGPRAAAAGAKTGAKTASTSGAKPAASRRGPAGPAAPARGPAKRAGGSSDDDTGQPT